MSILFFDTETTGLVDWDRPIDDPAQPKVIQLAAILEDDAGNEMTILKTLIRPEGWFVPDKVSAIHGITTEQCLIYGVRLSSAVRLFLDLLSNARLLVAHNISFDMRMMMISYLAVAGDDAMRKSKLHTIPVFCTKEQSASIVNLPPTERMIAAGMNKPKDPKLSEAYQFFFNERLEGAHDALVDVRACARVYHAIQERTAA
jgi:DNA polymerase-3 subunit epsilon